MRLGVDFGTTRIVIAAVDRGNYPVVVFDSPLGGPSDWYPALVAVKDGEPVFGWDAWAAQEDPGATVVRSIKRYLQEAGPQTRVDIGETSLSMMDLLTGLCSALKAALGECSSLKLTPGEPVEIMLGVPANANGNQRFLTVEAFRRAGYDVLGLLNEPSAASIEFGHGLRGGAGRSKDLILIYDLGGGTFDASLVELEENRHEVLASEGIPALGGDDFDELLADLALEAAGLTQPDRDPMSQAEIFRLHEECRRKKESLHPNTRRIILEMDQVRDGWEPVTVPVADFYSRGQALIDETIHAVEDLIKDRAAEIEALYVTGGASELPLVARSLKESFGRRVRRSAYARSATAIGLAIQADAQTGYTLREKFTRYFGVWREAEGGRTITFDPLYARGTPLPGPGEAPLTVSRRYCPAHNVGHFRYLECSQITDDGRPAGEITTWDEILFPFRPELAAEDGLGGVAVTRLNCGPTGEVEESYACDSSGAVTVTISHLTEGFQRTYRLGRWAQKEEPLAPARKRSRRAAAARPK
jgi:molecular chaperone DnaK